MALISQFIDIGFRRNLQGSSRLYVFGLRRKQTGQARHIRQHLAQFTQTQAAQLHIYILQGNGITPVGLHAETQPVVTVHIHIGIHPHILMQVNPITIIYKTEFTESNDRFGRYKVQNHTVSFAVTFGQRTGIDTEQHTGLSFSVHIVNGQFGIFIADFTSQGTAEHKLRILRSVNNPTLQLHTGGILLHGKKDSIQLKGVHVQPMHGSTPVDAHLWSKAETQLEIMV